MRLDGSVQNFLSLFNNTFGILLSKLRTVPKSVLFFSLFWFLYFAYFWHNALWYDQEGNFWVGHVAIWGDWAAHFTIQSQFAYRSLTAVTSPFLSGATLSYPFISDWLPAVLNKLGVSFFVAPVILSFLSSLLLVGAVWWFFATTLQSKKTAVVASFLFFFNGGLGFVYFLKDVIQAKNPLITLLNPPREYTSLEPELIRWISSINSMVIPQRAFTLGFPVAVILLIFIWKQFFVRQNPSKKNLLLTAVVLGVLPLFHTHSFLAVGIILACWSAGDLVLLWFKTRKKRNKQKIIQRLKNWMTLAVPAVAIALPLSVYFFRANTTSHFFTWHPGWYETTSFYHWVQFWFKNWGVFPLLAIFGFWISFFKNRALHHYAPYFLLFVLLNLVLFQPFIWDNTKILIWVHLGFSGLVALGFKQLWKSELSIGFNRMLVVLLFLLSTFSGIVDTYRVLRMPLHSYQMYSAEELALAEWARVQTTQNSIWLTSDQHNHWVPNLTGRQIIMGFRGWLWTHGYDYYTKEHDVALLFTDPETNKQLFKKHNISYVVIGPSEIHNWKADPAKFAKLFPVVKKTTHYTIFLVSL